MLGLLHDVAVVCGQVMIYVLTPTVQLNRQYFLIGDHINFSLELHLFIFTDNTQCANHKFLIQLCQQFRTCDFTVFNDVFTVLKLGGRYEIVDLI